MDIQVGIDFKENLLSLRNYISLGFRCDDIDFKNAVIASIDRMIQFNVSLEIHPLTSG